MRGTIKRKPWKRNLLHVQANNQAIDKTYERVFSCCQCLKRESEFLFNSLGNTAKISPPVWLFVASICNNHASAEHIASTYQEISEEGVLLSSSTNLEQRKKSVRVGCLKKSAETLIHQMILSYIIKNTVLKIFLIKQKIIQMAVKDFNSPRLFFSYINLVDLYWVLRWSKKSVLRTKQKQVKQKHLLRNNSFLSLYFLQRSQPIPYFLPSYMIKIHTSTGGNNFRQTWHKVKWTTTRSSLRSLHIPASCPIEVNIFAWGLTAVKEIELCELMNTVP